MCAIIIYTVKKQCACSMTATQFDSQFHSENTAISDAIGNLCVRPYFFNTINGIVCVGCAHVELLDELKKRQTDTQIYHVIICVVLFFFCSWFCALHASDPNDSNRYNSCVPSFPCLQLYKTVHFVQKIAANNSSAVPIVNNNLLCINLFPLAVIYGSYIAILRWIWYDSNRRREQMSQHTQFFNND